ncbi:DNA-binding NarL/FixJ family response regulator [Agromyces hippuratus]|uniref:DNA-binding NarL/FixJ family response regulator n=1 Tax=Agromyces hippuratus TaxID=286438 RepID=A0A852WPN2_9MICO|nr:response regulator transcription factor [Agromyces hippuratus]NYG19906.1 DNA-binding NarL/FixJ family response regulator [Agromyces hippuratus]
MSEPIRVAIADDHVLFCAGIEMIIRSQTDLEFAGTAHDGDDIVTLATEVRPDVILMDIRMPRADGITATRKVLIESPTSRVIVLTTHQRQEAVAHAIDAGAHGFLMKDARPELLLAAIRTVHEGNSVYAPSTTLALIRDLTPSARVEPDQQAIAALTAREREVYLLAARGLSNADIAESAYISETTVKSHISSILAKLELASRLQVVAHAYNHRLVQ